jgi:hypothetical protein
MTWFKQKPPAIEQTPEPPGAALLADTQENDPAPSLEITPCNCGGERTVIRETSVGRRVRCTACGAEHWQYKIPVIPRPKSLEAHRRD